MLGRLPEQAPDKIIALMGLFAADTRESKIDLGVGVYKDSEGKTPIMRAVKAAERQLVENQTSKSYVGLLGDLEFCAVMRDLVLGDTIDPSRVVAAQTPGGTGAIRQLYEMVRLANPDATIWMSDPTWPNHPAIAKSMGIGFETYPYLSAETLEVDFDAMMAGLAAAKEGDIVLLHGCCHNPTGANLSLEQWAAVTDFMKAAKLVPMIDIAYQGFGDGLDEDAAGVRLMAGQMPETLIAASCSKNFGVYRDRVGVMMAVTSSEASAALAKGAMASVNRLNYSFPPDHGAKVVQMVMTDAALRADWQAELEGKANSSSSPPTRPSAPPEPPSSHLAPSLDRSAAPAENCPIFLETTPGLGASYRKSTCPSSRQESCEPIETSPNSTETSPSPTTKKPSRAASRKSPTP